MKPSVFSLEMYKVLMKMFKKKYGHVRIQQL